MSETCKQCIYWLEKESWISNRNGERKIEYKGICRKNPPAFNPNHSDTSGWPKVYSDDWCGEFRLIEEKEDEPFISWRK